jgi:hypothetical protein
MLTPSDRRIITLLQSLQRRHRQQSSSSACHKLQNLANTVGVQLLGHCVSNSNSNSLQLCLERSSVVHTVLPTCPALKQQHSFHWNLSLQLQQL